ncbi:MAG: TPM domain-containing protein [Nanoarchaeota archaeon]|nr:TPM domain-containing protein [Nanoarchaeota archaeon]MBU1704216.1 TPM domain-containing protein [Nanoarchaeota archaeon]
MKKQCFWLIIVLLLGSFVSAVEISGLVNDYAGVLSSSERTELESVLKQIYDSGESQYAVVTIKSLEGQDIESYSLNLAQEVLGDKEKNNGLLLLVAIDDRKYRFEVGRGLEGIFNDAKIGRIGRQYLVDNFRAGEYGKGIIEASKAVRSVLLGDVEDAYYVDDSVSQEEVLISYLPNIIFLFIMLLFIFSAARKRGKHKDRFFDAAVGAMILFGGGRGGGGGGGGFGGFGGGGFGGGGAGSGW